VKQWKLTVVVGLPLLSRKVYQIVSMGNQRMLSGMEFQTYWFKVSSGIVPRTTTFSELKWFEPDWASCTETCA